MNKEKKRKAYNAYMRKWNQKNKDRINKQRSEKIKELKESNPEGYAEFREKANKRNQKYYGIHGDQVKKKAKAKNWFYDPVRRIDIRGRYYRRNPAKQVLGQRKKYAIKHNLSFNLTEEWYWQQVEKGCAMTGLSFDINGSDTPWVPHVDRIIPSKGYTPENCRLVCACYNLAKKHWTDADVLTMAKALIIRTADA